MISQYENLFKWYYRILTHTGTYGLGGAGLAVPATSFREMVGLVMGNILFFLILLFSVWFVFFYGRVSVKGDRTAKGDIGKDISFKILIAVTVAQLFSILITVKHSAERYLLPVLIFSGFMIFLMLLIVQRRNDFSRFSMKRSIIFTAVFLMIIGIWRMAEIKNILLQNVQIREEELAVYRKMENEYKDRMKIYCVFLSSSPAAALAFGNYFAIEGLYTDALQKIYGNVYFYDPFNKKFYNWTKEFAIEDAVLDGKGSKMVFHFPSLREYGEELVSGRGSVLHLRDVFNGQYETIYVLDGITLMWGREEIKSKPPSPFPDFSNQLK